MIHLLQGFQQRQHLKSLSVETITSVCVALSLCQFIKFLRFVVEGLLVFDFLLGLFSSAEAPRRQVPYHTVCHRRALHSVWM